jgi:hypothetical protein
MAILAVRKIQIYTLKIPGNGVLTGLDLTFFWGRTPDPPPARRTYGAHVGGITPSLQRFSPQARKAIYAPAGPIIIV